MTQKYIKKAETYIYSDRDGLVHNLDEEEVDAKTLDGRAATAFPWLTTKETTGDPAGPTEGLICINTFDKTVKVYADGDWRLLAQWGVS